MRDVSVLEPSDEVEFDVIATEVVEESSALPEEDRNQVDLHLVQLPGSQERLGRPRPMDTGRVWADSISLCAECRTDGAYFTATEAGSGNEAGLWRTRVGGASTTMQYRPHTGR